MWKFFIFMELELFSYYFMITKTLNLSNVKYILAHLNEHFTHKNILKAKRDNDIYTLQNER